MGPKPRGSNGEIRRVAPCAWASFLRGAPGAIRGAVERDEMTKLLNLAWFVAAGALLATYFVLISIL